MAEIVRILLAAHDVVHVHELDGWAGTKDIELYAKAKTESFQAIITNDVKQLNRPMEVEAIARSGLHRIQYRQNSKHGGLVGLGTAIATVCAALPHALAELEAAGRPATRLSHGRRSLPTQPIAGHGPCCRATEALARSLNTTFTRIRHRPQPDLRADAARGARRAGFHRCPAPQSWGSGASVPAVAAVRNAAITTGQDTPRSRAACTTVAPASRTARPAAPPVTAQLAACPRVSAAPAR